MTEPEELWAAYQRTPSKGYRDALIIHYSQLVEYVASRVAVGLPQNVERDDLVSYGMFGLIDAIDKFEPARGYKFETYAMARIKGAILDELRDLDWVPRSVREKARAVSNARAKLEAEHGGQVTSALLADELGVTGDALHRMLSQIASVDVDTFEVAVATDTADYEFTAEPPADDAPPLADMEILELRQALIAALTVLGEREAIVFGLYYRYNLTFAEIAVVFGVSESRIVQIHTDACRRVCERLSPSTAG